MKKCFGVFLAFYLQVSHLKIREEEKKGKKSRRRLVCGDVLKNMVYEYLILLEEVNIILNVFVSQIYCGMLIKYNSILTNTTTQIFWLLL